MLYTLNLDKDNKTYYRRSNTALFEGQIVVEIGCNSVAKGLKQIFKRDVYIIHYVTRGRGRFMNEEFSDGHCYFVSANELEIVEASDEDPYECYWIMLKGKNAAEIVSNCGLPEHNAVFPFEYVNDCAAIIHHGLFDEEYDNDYAEACKLEEVLYKLLRYHAKTLAVSTQKTPPHSKAAAIADYLKSNYKNDIKISDLCRVFYLSKNYLCTVFKNEYAVTPKEFLIAYRLLKAKELLRDTDCRLSVSEIARVVGIANPLYFSRLFKQKEGLSPTEYRNVPV